MGNHCRGFYQIFNKNRMSYTDFLLKYSRFFSGPWWFWRRYWWKPMDLNLFWTKSDIIFVLERNPDVHTPSTDLIPGQDTDPVPSLSWLIPTVFTRIVRLWFFSNSAHTISNRSPSRSIRGYWYNVTPSRLYNHYSSMFLLLQIPYTLL